MMKKLILTIFFYCLMPVFAASTVFVTPPEWKGTDSETLGAYGLHFLQPLVHAVLLESAQSYSNQAIKADGQHWMQKTILYEHENRVYIRAQLTNPEKARIDDEVFAETGTQAEIWTNIVRELNNRVNRRLQGEELPYFTGLTGPEEAQSGTQSSNQPLQIRPTRLSLISLASLGYSYPAGFQINALDAGFIIFPKNSWLGYGVSTALAKIYPAYPGISGMCGTVLPLSAMVSLYHSDSFDQYNELLFSMEWAWYKPISVESTNSGSAITNTNAASTFLDNPVNYLEWKLTWYFTGFASVNTGLHYQYGRGHWTFFAGASIMLGYLKKD